MAVILGIYGVFFLSMTVKKVAENSIPNPKLGIDKLALLRHFFIFNILVVGHQFI